MKTKVFAVMVSLSVYFCTQLSAQTLSGMHGKKGDSSPTPPVTNTTNNTTNNSPAKPKTQPQLDLSGKILTENNLRYVYNEVAKTKEYQAFAKKVNTKVNNSKVGKKVNSVRAFMQRIGLTKKTTAPKKSSK